MEKTAKCKLYCTTQRVSQMSEFARHKAVQYRENVGLHGICQNT